MLPKKKVNKKKRTERKKVGVSMKGPKMKKEKKTSHTDGPFFFLYYCCICVYVRYVCPMLMMFDVYLYLVVFVEEFRVDSRVNMTLDT